MNSYRYFFVGIHTLENFGEVSIATAELFKFSDNVWDVKITYHSSSEDRSYPSLEENSFTSKNTI